MTDSTERLATSPSNSSTSASSTGVIPGDWGLLDAEGQHDAFPDTFPIPSTAERARLRTGDMVKLVFVLDPPPVSGPNAERMWVEVRVARPDGTYEGWLTNKPVVITTLQPSSLVAFEPRHVAGIALRTEEVSFDVALKAVVSNRVFEIDGPPGWAGFDQPLDTSDSGWTVTGGDEADDYFGVDGDQGVDARTLGELVQRYPALVEVFQSPGGEWVYRPDHRRYVRLKNT